jgi:AraC-like DNA-binding protein
MPTVTAAFVKAMAKAAGLSLSEDGQLLCADVLLKRFNYPPDEQIPEDAYYDTLQCIRTHFGDDLGLMRAYAATITLDDLGVLGLAVKTAPDLRTALTVIQRYFSLMTDTVVYRFDETGDLAYLSIEEQTGRHPALRFRNECALFSLMCSISALCATDDVFQQVSFRHECLTDERAYVRHFGCDVRFGSSSDSLWISSDALATPIGRGDKAVCNFLVAHLEEELSNLSRQPPLMAELMQHVTRALQHGLPQAADIARTMGMSERTLYRRLADEGLTYRDALQKAQSELAHELLTSSDRSIAEIAFLTGFSEQSAFSRAFKRWSGLAPAQYRQKPDAV